MFIGAVRPKGSVHKVAVRTASASTAKAHANKGVATAVTTPEQTGKYSLRSLAIKGYKKAVGQSFTVSSVSMNLRIGSSQFRSLLGTGLATALGSAGIYAGFAAAGLRTAGGAEKVVTAVKTRDFGKALDGFKDFGSASVLGLTCAGMWAARKIALPAAAGFETFRGAFNFTAGWLTNDKKRQARGLFDAVGAAGRAGRALKKYSPFLGKAGLVLAPVAGALQVKRGLDSLSLGLEKNNNKVELRGVVDIASAVGLTMLFTGLAATPGLAIFSVAQFVSTAYTMSATARKVVDPVIDKMEPRAIKIADGIRGIKADLLDKFKKLPNPFPGSGDKPKEPRDGSLSSTKEPATENDSSVWYNEWLTGPEPDGAVTPDEPDLDEDLNFDSSAF